MAGLLTIEEYIAKRKEKVSIFVDSTHILKECKNTKPSPYFGNQLVWWKNLKNEIEKFESLTEISGNN